MICRECGAETPGINHNNRGLRCTACFARLVATAEPAPAPGLEPEADLAAPAEDAPAEPATPDSEPGEPEPGPAPGPASKPKSRRKR